MNPILLGIGVLAAFSAFRQSRNQARLAGASKRRRNPSKHVRRARKQESRRRRVARRLIREIISEEHPQYSRAHRRRRARYARQGGCRLDFNDRHRYDGLFDAVRSKRRNPGGKRRAAAKPRRAAKRRRKGTTQRTVTTTRVVRVVRKNPRRSFIRRTLARVRDAARRNKRSGGSPKALYASVMAQSRAGRMGLGRSIGLGSREISAAVQRGIKLGRRRNPRRRSHRKGVTPSGAAARLAQWRWHHNPCGGRR